MTAVQVGTRFGPCVVDSVSSEHMRTLAELLADPNPIHVDRDAVAELGLGTRLINQGPANVAYILNMLRESAPSAQLTSLTVRFLSNVFERDRVEAASEVLRVERVGDEERATCAVWLDAGEGRRAVEGMATLVWVIRPELEDIVPAES